MLIKKRKRPSYLSLFALKAILLGAIISTAYVAISSIKALEVKVKEHHDVLFQTTDFGQITFLHGTLHFSSHFHQIQIPDNELFDPSSSWTSLQRQLLNDSRIDLEVEKERCASYGFGLSDKRTRRRRLFLGSLIADDTDEVLQAVGTEAYEIFHTVAFIETNVTQNFTPRTLRYVGSDNRNINGNTTTTSLKRLRKLYQLFGPATKVSVDYYETSLKIGDVNTLLFEDIQREGFSHRWKLNGMRPDDVAVVADADETFTRDFLRALQICDVPQFRPGQSCLRPKLLASTMVLESSSECITKGRRWYHPDAMSGECIDQVGDDKVHPETKREWKSAHGFRLEGYGKGGNYSRYESDGLGSSQGPYPLWTSGDVRMETGGEMVSKQDQWKSPTGYHFHNYFRSIEQIRFKYATYGHENSDAWVMPLWELSEDLEQAVHCANGNYRQSESFDSIQGSAKPIFYLNKEVLTASFKAWQNVVKGEEKK